MAARLQNLSQAPEFALNDTQGNPVPLSDYRGKQPVLLVFTRGFI